ncbi:MAG TPA: hypothetical protein DD379_22785 [Cyanobacteria bacterium UBA11162]|nr:hypothetical protein [Cyanobacteria bacterium UBA11162]
MVKKRLTDLLREEVDKSPEPEGETVQETTPEQVLDQDTEAVEESVMNTRTRANAKPSTATKAELEETVTQLKAALEEAQQRETTLAELKDALEEAKTKESSLQEQVTNLQSDLQHQKESFDKLQKELEKIDKLKTEFEQAKNAAVQLAQANEKLTKEIELLKKGNESVKETPTQSPVRQLGRPVQKESDKPADFAKSSWLL